MPLFTPESLARGSGGRWTQPPAAPITGFMTDTRQLRAGQAFVALRTERRDGHGFLSEAAAAGASAAVVAAEDTSVALPQLVVADTLAAFQSIAREHRRAFPGAVIGISGSAGKTSTKDLLALLLGGAEGRTVLATEGNLNNHIGVPLTLTRLDPAVHHYAVVEAGISAPGEMAPLASMIEPDIAIITLVAPAHLAQLGDIETVAREKAALPAAARRGGIAIFPQSCCRFAAFRELAVPAIVVGCADGGPPGPAAGETSLVRFSVEHRDESTTVTLAGESPVTETYVLARVSGGMAQNAALAICAALRLGVARAAIRERLLRWQPAPLRGEMRRDAGRLLYLDCYNANPAAMADALAAFRAIAPAGLPRLFVLGGMEDLGPGSAWFHRELGRSVALRPEDFLCAIGDEAGEVQAGARERGARQDQILAAGSAEAAAARVADFKGAVFIKGSRRWQLERIVAAEGGAPH